MDTPATPRSYTPELCHLASFLGFVFPFGNILGPLGIWLWKRHEEPVVDAHGKEAINFQISMTIYSLVFVILGFVSMFVMPFIINSVRSTAGAYGSIALLAALLLPMFALFFANVLLTIRAAIHANRGILTPYPMSLRLLR